MSGPILILGGAGNFGKRIAIALHQRGLPIIIAGRDAAKAAALAARLPGARSVAFDVNTGLAAQLAALQPSVVVNTCGPFQQSDYRVAQACVAQGCHYVDLADGRAFVTGIAALDAAAKARDVSIISGASTVPGLSSAVLAAYRHEFETIASLRYGISPGQRAERGLATTQGIMSYVGKPLRPFAGCSTPAFGWQDIYRQTYPELGTRWMANCDIPDLDLLPAHFGLQHIRFSAGLELAPLHLGLWALSWLVRLGAPLDLPRYAAPLLAASNWFNRCGTAAGGMHMIMTGTGSDGQPHCRRWFIIARAGDGPHIPTIPAILLAERLATGHFTRRGALPCVGLVTLTDYLTALAPYAVQTYADTLAAA